MTFEVRIARRAEDDLRDIYEYIAFDLGEPEVARRVILRLQEAADGLAALPERHRLVDAEPWRSRNTRYMVIGNYLMFYVVDTEEGVVSIIRIVYGGRDVHRQLQRLLG